MKKIKLKKIFLFGFVTTVSVVVFGTYVYSAGYTPLEPSVAGDMIGGNMGDYFNGIYKLGIAIAGVLAVLYIVIGGFQYMLSESIFAKGAGKDRIWAALGGLILALASWMILNTINSDLVNFDLKLPETRVIPNNGNVNNESYTRYEWCRKGFSSECFNTPELCSGSISWDCDKKTINPVTLQERIAPVGNINIGEETTNCSLTSCVSEQSNYFNNAYSDCPIGSEGNICREGITSGRSNIQSTCQEIIKSCNN